MGGYRCYILDADDHIVQAHDIECESDEQAAVTAGGMLTQDPYYKAVEVWRTTRLVIKLDRSTGLQALSWEPAASLAR